MSSNVNKKQRLSIITTYKDDVFDNFDLFSLILLHLSIKEILKNIIFSCNKWYNLFNNKNNLAIYNCTII